MINLEIKSMHSPDVSVDQWQPESDAVWFLLELEIGEKGDVAADVFEVMIATPQGLAHQATADDGGVLVRRGTLVLREFSWAGVRRALEGIVRECEAEDWSSCVLRLQRFFFWEYEDYVLE